MGNYVKKIRKLPNCPAEDRLLRDFNKYFFKFEIVGKMSELHSRISVCFWWFLFGLLHHLGVYCFQVFIQTEPALNAIAFDFYFFKYETELLVKTKVAR